MAAQHSVRRRVNLRSLLMKNDEFWKLIELIDVDALEDGDEDQALHPLGVALGATSLSDIESFHEHLCQALFAIDGKSYADNAGDSGGSDDGFLYVRCYVVARGLEYYSQVQASPAKMPRSVDQWCESLLYVAASAWANKTGNDPSDWKFSATVSYESGSNSRLWRVAGP